MTQEGHKHTAPWWERLTYVLTSISPIPDTSCGQKLAVESKVEYDLEQPVEPSAANTSKKGFKVFPENDLQLESEGGEDDGPPVDLTNVSSLGDLSTAWYRSMAHRWSLRFKNARTE